MRTADEQRAPLVVAGDGTLVKVEFLHEKVMQFIAQKPLAAWRLPLWLAQGRRALERELDARVSLAIDTTPLREETKGRIRDAQAQGRSVYLVSASRQGLIQQLADFIGGITRVFVTDCDDDVGDERRAEKLNAALRPGRYDYIGSRSGDFVVWSSARHVLAVSPSATLGRDTHRNFPNAGVAVVVSAFSNWLLLFWVSRVIVPASRNELHHDPVTFALSDRTSWLTGMVAAAI